jgi:exosortase
VATLPAEADKPAATPWRPRVSEAVAVLGVVTALVVAYEPSLRLLVGQWSRDPNYQYGFLVVPIAAWIFWDRRGLLDRAKMRPHWWGFLPLAAVVALRFPLFEWNEQYVETATLPLVAACLALALGGWHLLKVALPSLIFLFFMLPLPPSINLLLARPLQTVATLGSVTLLQLLGLPVMAEGNVIIIGATPLEVERACNGLNMLLSFVTLTVAVVILFPRPAWERLLLLLSAVPIALLCNILRIAATAVCYYYLGHETTGPDAHDDAAWVLERAHDTAGWFMMPMAMLLVWLELKLFSWVVVEVEELPATDLLRKGRGVHH